MRVAALGDVHGNAPALAAVLADVQSQGLRHLLVTGDFVGYYYHPDHVLALFDGWTIDAVQGNHEGLLAAGRHDPAVLEQHRRYFGHGLDAALRLSPAAVEWLTGLPHRRTLALGNRSLLLCHGAPWDRDAYVYPDALDDLARCAGEAVDVIVMGHTHYPLVRTINGRLLVNPGSVGQPRDGDLRASWAALDLGALAAEIRRVPYPVEEVAAEARGIDPDIPYLVNVLSGRRPLRHPLS